MELLYLLVFILGALIGISIEYFSRKKDIELAYKIGFIVASSDADELARLEENSFIKYRIKQLGLKI